MRRLAIVLVGLLPAAMLQAQRVAEIPRRPNIGRSADTNSAAAYAAFGMRQIQQNPRDAAAAFYWAGRLNPESAEYPYARRIALMLTDATRLTRYYDYDYSTMTSPEMLALDSLLRRALMMDPFLHLRLEDVLEFEAAKLMIQRQIRNEGGAVEAGDLNFYIQYLADRSPSFAATREYSAGRFRDALRHWASVVRQRPKNPYLHALRARAFFLMGGHDSARAEMETALSIARQRDADSVRFFYESKGAWEYSLGRIHERLGNNSAAREAFERALVEDLSYYPAHIQLGLLHAAAGDTVAALREMRRAVMVKEDEYLPRLTLAYYLASTAQLDSSAVHLRHAAELEPFAAAPLLMLGSVLDAKGDAAGALSAYNAFLVRASRDDPDIEAARSRMDALRGR